MKNREVVDKLTAMGWTLKRMGKHYVFCHAAVRKPLIVPVSPSDVRGAKNTIARAKRFVKEGKRCG